MPIRGKCRACGCTQANCQACIRATGHPCSWSDESHTHCTACVCRWCGRPFEARKDFQYDEQDRRICRGIARCVQRRVAARAERRRLLRMGMSMGGAR